VIPQVLKQSLRVIVAMPMNEMNVPRQSLGDEIDSLPLWTILGKGFCDLAKFVNQFEDAATLVARFQKVERQKKGFDLLVRVLVLGIGLVMPSLVSELEELFGEFGHFAQVCGTSAVGRLRALPLLFQRFEKVGMPRCVRKIVGETAMSQDTLRRIDEKPVTDRSLDLAMIEMQHAAAGGTAFEQIRGEVKTESGPERDRNPLSIDREFVSVVRGS